MLRALSVAGIFSNHGNENQSKNALVCMLKVVDAIQ